MAGVGVHPIHASSEPLSPALRLQILMSEHSNLQSTRALAWNEVFARASTYLSTLGAATVALALAGQGSGFGTNFLVLGVVILPVVLVIGITTHVRMGASNAYEAMCVVGMNRIRHAYLELAPELTPYFVMSEYDDPRGVATSEGLQPGATRMLHRLASTPIVIAIVNSVVAGGFACMLALLAAVAGPDVLVVGVAAFASALTAHLRYGARNIARAAAVTPLFPSASVSGR
jgi:hypothetical protein